jgi:hypothetical protein
LKVGKNICPLALDGVDKGGDLLEKALAVNRVAYDVIAYPSVGIRIIEPGDRLLVTSQSCPDDMLHVHPIKLSFIVMMPYWMKRLHDDCDFLRYFKEQT